MLKLKILVVDDSPVITEMVQDAFTAEGYRVLTADDGARGLELALSENPDLIIADIQMPGMDGWELCSQIRSNPYTSFIPFMFLTQKSDSPDRIKGLQMGADDYLTKPFAMEELVARVNLILQRVLKTQEAMLTRKSKSLSGTTSEIGLADLLQMFAINQKTGRLKITRTAQPTGFLAFLSGKLIRAELGNLTGQKVVYRLLGWQDANFEVEPLIDLGQDESLPERVETLLMEGARQIDEINVLENNFSLADKYLRVRDEKLPLISELSEQEQDILEAIEKKPDFSEVLDSLSYPDLEIYKTVVKFFRQGIIEARG
jgi:DNA-binding response OmpR family regulator